MIWELYLSTEVERWYLQLSEQGIAEADAAFERLISRGNQLCMPHSKPLSGGLFELRFNCENKATRVTYTYDTERHIITLTQFVKQKNNEQREILRARKVQKLERIRREKESGDG